MSFFNPDTPIFRRKQSAFEIQNTPRVWRVHWQFGDRTVLSTFYTQHDQACILWGLLSGAIFVTAQFLPLDWATQASFSSVFTLIGILGMMALTWHFTAIERLSWVLYCWIFLMLVGMVLTNLSVFLQWGAVLAQICPLWLGLSAIGYFCTGLGVRSRTFILVGAIHLLTIWVLPYVGAWKPLTTGIVISLSVLLLAELQWDSHGVCGHEPEYSLSDSE